jgi:hypothetical protein
MYLRLWNQRCLGHLPRTKFHHYQPLIIARNPKQLKDGPNLVGEVGISVNLWDLLPGFRVLPQGCMISFCILKLSDALQHLLESLKS